MPIDISDFAALAGGSRAGPMYGFDVSVERTAAVLRRLADDLEGKRVLLQDVFVVGRGKRDNFTSKRVILAIVEPIEKAP